MRIPRSRSCCPRIPLQSARPRRPSCSRAGRCDTTEVRAMCGMGLSGAEEGRRGEQGEERCQRVWGARVNKQVQPGPILALLMQPMWGTPIHMKRRASTAVFALFAQRLSSNASRSLLAVQLLHDAISVFVKELRAGGPMREGASAAEAAEQQSSSGAAAAAQGPAAAGGGAAQAAAPKEAPKEAAKTSKPAAGGSGGHELRLKERFYAGASDLYECFTDARRIMAFTQSPAEAQVWWGEAGQGRRRGRRGGCHAAHGSAWRCLCRAWQQHGNSSSRRDPSSPVPAWVQQSSTLRPWHTISNCARFAALHHSLTSSTVCPRPCSPPPAAGYPCLGAASRGSTQSFTPPTGWPCAGA